MTEARVGGGRRPIAPLDRLECDSSARGLGLLRASADACAYASTDARHAAAVGVVAVATAAEAAAHCRRARHCGGRHQAGGGALRAEAREGERARCDDDTDDDPRRRRRRRRRR